MHIIKKFVIRDELIFDLKDHLNEQKFIRYHFMLI